MKITNPPETKQIITCPTEREQPLHHFSGHSPPLKRAPMFTRVDFLYPEPFFLAAFSASGFLFQGELLQVMLAEFSLPL